MCEKLAGAKLIVLEPAAKFWHFSQNLNHIIKINFNFKYDNSIYKQYINTCKKKLLLTFKKYNNYFIEEKSSMDQEKKTW